MKLLRRITNRYYVTNRANKLTSHLIYSPFSLYPILGFRYLELLRDGDYLEYKCVFEPYEGDTTQVYDSERITCKIGEKTWRLYSVKYHSDCTEKEVCLFIHEALGWNPFSGSYTKPGTKEFFAMYCYFLMIDVRHKVQT